MFASRPVRIPSADRRLLLEVPAEGGAADGGGAVLRRENRAPLLRHHTNAAIHVNVRIRSGAGTKYN